MAYTQVNAGEVLAFEYMLNKTEPTDWVLRLFTSNTTPAEDDTSGDYTEAAAAGYSAITLVGSSWSVSTTSNVTTAAYAEQTFTFTTSVSCYGYYYTNDGSSIMGAERFSGAPYTLPTGGGSISVTPTITLD